MSKDTKVCLHCNIEKSLEEYPKYKGRDGNHAYRNVCKVCFNAQTNKNRTTDYKPRLKEEIPEEYRIERNIYNMFNESDISILRKIIDDYKSNTNKDIELEKGDRERKTYNIEKALSKKILQEARKQGITASDILNIAVRKYFFDV